MRQRLKLILLSALIVFTSSCSGNKSVSSGTAASASSETTVTVTEAKTSPETEITAVSEEEITSASEETSAVAAEEPSELMKQYSGDDTELKGTYAEAEKKGDLPAVHISTYNDEEILSKEEYVSAVVDVINCGEEYRLTAEGGVKVRGNSTAEGEIKPYRIKFDKKQNMLGLHGGEEYKSWVLLLSQWNLVPDYTGFALAEAIFGGEYYSSDCTYVDLYINGKYIGLYLLCEQNQAAKGRVDVYEPKEDETGTSIGYFVEIDNYASEEEGPYFNIDLSNVQFTDIEGKTSCLPNRNYTVKSDTTSKEQVDFISKYIRGVFKIMYEAVENGKILAFDGAYNVVSGADVYDSPKKAVEAVIDLDSVVNTMILQELVHNYDVGNGSFYMAVDFSENSRYERLTFLAPWDFNWGYDGETHGKYYAGAFQEAANNIDRSNPWLTVIMKADWFRDMIKEKWAELDNGESLKPVLNEILETIKTLDNYVGEEKWKLDSGRNVVAFVKGRINWLNTRWSE